MTEPNIEQLRTMLKNECSIRNTERVQYMYDEKLPNIEYAIQQDIIKSHGFDITVDRYRQLLSKNRDKFKNDAFFIKHNIMVDCPISIGEIDPELLKLTLYNIDGLKPTILDSLITKRTIILASSST